MNFITPNRRTIKRKKDKKSNSRKEIVYVQEVIQNTPHTGVSPDTSASPRWWNKRLSLKSIGVVSLAFLVYLSQLFFEDWAVKPIWPTEPVIELGLPSASDPFTIPFAIQNHSVLFPVFINTYICEFNASYDGNVIMDGMRFIGSVNRELGPEEQLNLRCAREGLSSDKVVMGAKVSVSIRFAHRLGDRQIYGTQIYKDIHWDSVSNPPRWLKGPIY